MLKDLLELEKKLVFTKFSSNDAFVIGKIMIKKAETLGKGGIGIKIEKNRHTLFSFLMDGTMPENEYWYNRKKNVVDRYFHSSKYVEEMYLEMGSSFAESGLLDQEDFQAVGGSFPLIIKGVGVVGSITVCGLTGELDHQICVESISEYLFEKGGES